MVHSNGIAKAGIILQPLLNTLTTEFQRPAVNEALYRWYNYFKFGMTDLSQLFLGDEENEVLVSFKKDMEIFPSILMDEINSNQFHYERNNYIHLVQALLINISDLLFDKEEVKNQNSLLENNIQFLQSFYYQYFNFDSPISKYGNRQFIDCYKLKIEYWKLKLPESTLLISFEECFTEKIDGDENRITYRKLGYLKNLLLQIETATTIISENYVRSLLFYYNFNSPCFIEYETEQIKEKIKACSTNPEMILLLQSDMLRIEDLKSKSSGSFETSQPSVKKQLLEWITNEIKRLELQDRKAADKDLLIDTESKIQTSLSVAKLAVLIRLMVADKIIINKTVAPMLRTVTKLFTTLQKDEISFGSLETKYHAPDKATLNNMKEMLVKWGNLMGRL